METCGLKKLGKKVGAGCIHIFFADGGFGFASPDGGSDDVYPHVKDNPNIESCFGCGRVVFTSPTITAKATAKVPMPVMRTTGMEHLALARPRQAATIARSIGKMSRASGIQSKAGMIGVGPSMGTKDAETMRETKMRTIGRTRAGKTKSQCR